MSDAHMRLRIGPAIFDLRSPFRRSVGHLAKLYRDYPQGMDGEVYDFAVRARPVSPLRRWVRPTIVFDADFMVEDIVPVEARLGLLGFEMAINMQMALGYRREIVFHAASAAKDDRAILIVGDSGAGKSTLSALLSYQAGWRHMGDELALLTFGPEAVLRPYPRPIGLKNESIAVMRALAPADRFGPLLTETVKGTVQHLLPPQSAISTMDEPARPALIVSPRFRAGAAPEQRRMTQSEAYLRLSVASTNQLTLGEAGFETLVDLVRNVPAYDIVYGSSEDALSLVDDLWREAR
ncbi:MAG: HprK-related kinase A [Pseudomonadota bacterium]